MKQADTNPPASTGSPMHTPDEKHGADGWRHFRNAFIAGLVLLAPIGVTLFVLNLLRVHIGEPASRILFGFVDGPWRTLPGVNLLLDFIALLIVLVLITLLGLLSNYFVTRFFLRTGERIIDAVPLINTVYKSAKQIVDTFSRQQKAVFQKVVLVEFPRRGLYVIGFLTNRAKGEVQGRIGKEVVNVFIPTTPNPTSGFLLMVPADDVTELDMTVADGIKLVVSGGGVTPDWLRRDIPGTPAEQANPVAEHGP